MVVFNDDFPMVESKKYTLNLNNIPEYWVAQKIITAYHQLGDVSCELVRKIYASPVQKRNVYNRSLTHPPGN